LKEKTMIDPPVILQTKPQLTAVIHLTIPREEMRTVMGPALRELHAVAKATGPWFTRHFKMEPKVFDFEVGIPVSAPVKPSGRVVASELPAMTVARAVLRGSYEQLAAAWPELDAWIATQGRTPGPSLIETYVVDPGTNPDPSAWRTELTRPLG
jgi:effector-binding domain-containing protein